MVRVRVRVHLLYREGDAAPTTTSPEAASCIDSGGAGRTRRPGKQERN